MMRIRGRNSATVQTLEWRVPRLTTLFLSLIIVSTIGVSKGEYLMGGHLDNKDDQGSLLRRSDDESETMARSPVMISSRTANVEDLDFDLGLDLLAEQSAVDPSRLSSEDATAFDGEEPGIAPRYRVPLAPYAFNGGQPFSLEKDPITGQIDFEKAPPLKVLDYSAKSPEDESSEDDTEESSKTITSTVTKSQSDESVGPNEINPYSPSFHDFLNLPVRYTYNKYDNAEKYPLISSSYANTKVQSGSNSYNTYNHKKYHESVKASVNMHLQPSRKTHIQSVTRATTTTTKTTRQPQTEPSIKLTTAFTTSKPTTTTTKATTTTTTESPTTTTTVISTTKRLVTIPPVTTWKPQKLSDSNKYHVDDYEATLPIERLQPISNQQSSITTEPSRYDSPPSRPSHPTREDEPNEEYEEGYEDYDRIFQSSDKPMSHDHQDSSEGDYSYGLDFFGVGSRPSMKPAPTTTTEKEPISTTITTSTTNRPVTSSSTIKILDQPENRPTTTTLRPMEEKRVTSMPLDTSDHYISNYPNNVPITGTIDNNIPSVTNNVIYHPLRPSTNDQYYGRPSMGMSAPGIVVKSTSNVVVPPGQDTVSFVLGNRQSVGGAGDTGGEYYPVHSGSISDQSGINFGKIGGRPTNVDNYPGQNQMIVSAGIGVGSNSAGSYNQRPQNPGNPPFDHALVSVGLPTVDVVNPSDAQTAVNKNSDSSTSNGVDTLAQKWWASTISSNTKPQLNLQQELPNKPQFGYHVVFPDEVKNHGVATDKSQGTSEEHVIVVHESELGAGNTLHLELPSQHSSTLIPTTGFRFETTTLKYSGKPEEHGGLPELSESLTPPTERPNKLQLGHRPPNYNYYHHQSLPPRPNEYPRPQRVPLPPPPPQSSSSSSNSFKRRPTSSMDTNLPNILPQFRPNAKVSHGHNRGDNNVGTIPAGALGHYPNTIIRRPPTHHHHLHRPTSPRRPTGPSHLQRLNPPPLPPPPPPITSLRLPTPAALIAPAPSVSHDSQTQINDNIARLTVQKRLSVGVPQSLNIDERHQTFGSQQSQQIKSRLEDDNLERFSAEPPQQPPRAPFFGKRVPTDGNDPEGVPRVATLQMIQQHGGEESIVKTKLSTPYRFNFDKRPSNRHDNQEIEDNSRPDDRRGDNEANSSDLPSSNDDSTDSSVYVVYPVKGALDIRPTSNEGDDNGPEDATVVLGKYGSQRPLPPDTLLKDTNDESSNNDHQSYRPSSSSPQLASDFPYPLERPDPSMFTGQLREKPLLVPSEQQKNGQDEDKNDDTVVDDDNSQTDIDRDASVNVIPYPQDHIPFGLGEHSGAISATLHRLSGFSSIVDSSSTPIAYVYTPTMRPPIRRPEEGYGHASFERAPVLLQSQHTNDANSGPAAPQSFMAPFVASASAEAPTKNGWSVVMLEKSPNTDFTNMDRRRADIDVNSESDKDDNNDDKNENKKDDEKNETKKEETVVNDEDTQTEKSDFNVENFTPQLFGGFKPIFEFPSDSDTETTLGDKVSAGALAIERPRSGTEIHSRKLENH